MNNTQPLSKIDTKYLILEEISEADLYGIIDLRTKKKDNHLTPINASIDAQLEYFNKYKIRRANGIEVYYKIINKAQPKIITGLVRLTEISTPDKFSWESLIVVDGSPPYISLDAMMTIYRIGFERLDKKSCGPWTIPINANTVLNLHKKVGMASEISRDNEAYYMVVSREAFLKRYDFFRKLGYGLYNI